MGWKGKILELPLSVLAARAAAWPSNPASRPCEILVLRNNDIGDLLVTTPLFESLRHGFSSAKICVAVGGWNIPVLANNPNVDDVIELNAPWINKFTGNHTPMRALRYVLASPEVAALRGRRFDIGIDVVGTRPGAMLMMRLGIPFRVGQSGLCGGHSTFQRAVPYDPDVHVGRAALKLGEEIGAVPVDTRPQIFLTDDERQAGESRWSANGGTARVLVAPGGGFAEKCWPAESFRELTGLLAAHERIELGIVGGLGDVELGRAVAGGQERVTDWCGRLSLRETFALVATADAVVCNSSMIMHVAAAFERPAVVLLGDWFASATAHARTWGHPGSSRVLGKEPSERSSLATPAEAYHELLLGLPGASGQEA